MFTIRPFEKTDKDYEGFVAVKNAAWPDEPTTVKIARHNDNDQNPKYLHQRYLVETTDKQIIGEGGTWESQWSYIAGKYNINFDLHPDWQNKGVEQQLYDHILKFLNNRDLKPIILDSFTRADKEPRMQFLESQGFQVIQRENVSVLDVQDYDFGRFPDAHQRVLDQDIELLTLTELRDRDPDWMQKYYDLIIPIDRDIPSPDEQTPQGIEELAKDFKHPCFLPDGHFIAVDNGQWVGLSSLWKDDVRTDRIWVGLTGVLRSHRRRGIAKALKLLTFKYAQARNARYIETGNEENNPMYDLNVQLGFTPKPQWLEYRNNLKD
ncbi:MAG: GNAT family N-acetyltransferase [Chloroflexota bacterium]